MPYKEHRVVKVYYTIGEVIKVINVRLELRGKRVLTVSALRYYETFHSKVRASKISRNGERRYTQANVEAIARFVRIIMTRWFTLKGAVAIMSGSIEITIPKQSKEDKTDG